MDIALSYYEYLGLYMSDDLMWVYDPNSNQLYQQTTSGTYEAVAIEQPGASDYYQGYPSYQQYPTMQPSPQPTYVTPPRPGIPFLPNLRPATSQPLVPARPAAPVVAPRVTTVGQPSGYTQVAPPPRPGGAPAPLPRLAAPQPVGSGGSVRMKNEPDPKQGYWEAFHMIGYWADFGDSRHFFQGPYPIKRVRLSNGQPWPHGKLSIFEGRGEKAGIYFMLYDSPDAEWPHKKYSDTIRAVQVKPVIPF